MHAQHFTSGRRFRWISRASALLLGAAGGGGRLPFSTDSGARSRRVAVTLRRSLPVVSSHVFSPSCVSSSLATCSSVLRVPRRRIASVSTQELRNALRLLGLSDTCTDAEIKTAFQAFAKANHPDTFSHLGQHGAATTSASAGGDTKGGRRATRDGFASAFFADRFANEDAAGEPKTRAQSPPRDDRTTAEERMAAGTEAYQLLKRLSFAERQMILTHSGGGGHRRNFYTYDDFSPGGPGRDGFRYTEEEFAKAQAAYAGRPRSASASGGTQYRGMRDHTDRGGCRVHTNSSGDGGENDFFDPRTAEGRRRTARFNKVTSRIEQLRRRAGRDAAPWKVADGDGTYPGRGQGGRRHGAPGGDSHQQRQQGRAFQGAAEFFYSAHRGAQQRSGAFRMFRDRFSYGPGFSLRFYFSQIKDDLRELRRQYNKDKTFAGIHGARYDGPEQEAKIREELGNHPQLRQYLLLKQRAREKAVVDEAVGRLMNMLLFVFVAVLVGLLAVSMVRTRRAKREYARMKAAQEAQGGG